MKSFDAYAQTHYADHGELLVPNGFADAAKMNSVDGDRNNSLLSPLRVEYYSEATMVFSALAVFLSLIELQAEHDTTAVIALAASTAIMGAGAIVRDHAMSAVNSILQRSS